MYPGITICIAKPFIAKTLFDVGINVTVEEYNKYLKGAKRYHNDERLGNISFEIATFDVFDYLLHPIMVKRRDGTYENESDTWYKAALDRERWKSLEAQFCKK